MPAETLRRALVAFRRDQARARVARFRGVPTAESEHDVLRDHAWLTSDEAQERLAEAEGEGALPPDEARAMRAHVADVHAERELAKTRAAWRALPAQVLERGGHRERCIDLVEQVCAPLAGANAGLRASGAASLERAAAEVAPRVEDAWQRARARRREVLGGGSATEGGAAATATALELARVTLDASDDLAAEALSRAAALAGVGEAERWDELAALLSFPALAGRFGPRDRARRVAAPFAQLGFAKELEGVRLEPPHASVGVNAQLAVLDRSRDVRVSASARELGLASELALLTGVGRALGQRLLPAALPLAQGLPVVDEGPRALAALMVQLPCDPVFLGRERTLSRERPAIAAAGVCLQLSALRVAAATVLAEDERGRDVIEGLAERALGVPLPLPLARLLLVGDVGAHARLGAGLRGLLFWSLLRDAHDEDWFRNPRVAETLRASLALSATRGELGLPGIWDGPLGVADVPRALSRVRELLAG